MELGVAIKQIRERLKLSQVKLAELSDIKPQYLCRIEKGNINPGEETLKKISKGLDIPISYIYLYSMRAEDFQEDKQALYTMLLKPFQEMLLTKSE